VVCRFSKRCFLGSNGGPLHDLGCMKRSWKVNIIRECDCEPSNRIARQSLDFSKPRVGLEALWLLLLVGKSVDEIK
jgi:hypothetical protein